MSHALFRSACVMGIFFACLSGAASADDNPATAPVTVPAAVENVRQNFFESFSPNEPVYFLYGPKSPEGKFQLSFKYRLIDGDPQGKGYLNHLYVGYSQTSLWNIGQESSPFRDTVYRPEVLYVWDRAVNPFWFQKNTNIVSLQAGLQHESNGQGGTLSRSIPAWLYVQPTFGLWPIGQPPAGDGFELLFQPRARLPIGSLSRDNPDLITYRGYFDLRMILRMPADNTLSVTGRVGSDWNHGSVQVDLNIPFSNIGRGLGNLDWLGMRKWNTDLQIQYFTGQGESLRDYNVSTDQIRIGIGLLR